MTNGSDVVREASALLRTPGAHYDQCGSRCEVWQWPHCVDCLTAETMVWTPTGARPITEMAVGDLVWAFKDGELVQRIVTRLIRKDPQNVFRVRTTRRLVRATANHPFLQVRRTHGLRWQTIEGGLARGDWLVTLAETPHAEAVPILDEESGLTATADLCWLVGLALADGHVSDGHGISIAVYGDLRIEAREVCERLFDGMSGWGFGRTHRGPIGCSENISGGLHVNSSAVARLFRRLGFGAKSHEKSVPSFIWTLPRKQIEAFLAGYRAGDGHDQSTYRDYAAWTYSSSSERLAREARALHQMLGDNTSQIGVNRRTKPITIKGVLVKNARPLWSFEVYPESNRRGQDDLKWARRYLPEPFSVERVLAVEPGGFEETWDLTVDDAHSFIADGLVVHNCSGLTSATLNQLGLNEGCTGSFQQSIESHRAGGGLPFSIALNTPGAFAWQGINQGQGGTPGVDPGHVGIFVGDGVHTLEARGHWAGIGLFYARSLVWDYCGMMPNVQRADGPISVPLGHPLPPHPPQITQEDPVSMVALPNTAATMAGREASARPVKGYNFVLLEDGGRVAGDVAVDPAKPNGPRHWWAPTPAERPPGSQIIDCMKSLDGKFLVARYGYPNGDAGTYRTAIVGA